MRVLAARGVGEGALQGVFVLEIGETGEIVAQNIRVEARLEARPAQALGLVLAPEGVEDADLDRLPRPVRPLGVDLSRD